MELIVRQGEREEKVRVRKDGDRYEVKIGERTWTVDAKTARGGLRSLLIDGAHHEVAVSLRGEDYWVSTRDGGGPVAVTDPLTHLASQTRAGGGGKRRQKINAYMPGRVVALLVEEGQEVTAGQGVVVLEAMKMQNEIRAEHDGKITRIHVQPGQAVEGGDPLFEMD
ncbi:MAG: acetyl-CoA carboxylase biotin carboxyl carrier protein subunit [Acidobacteriota bacterium]